MQPTAPALWTRGDRRPVGRSRQQCLPGTESTFTYRPKNVSRFIGAVIFRRMEVIGTATAGIETQPGNYALIDSARGKSPDIYMNGNTTDNFTGNKASAIANTNINRPTGPASMSAGSCRRAGSTVRLWRRLRAARLAYKLPIGRQTRWWAWRRRPKAKHATTAATFSQCLQRRIWCAQARLLREPVADD